MSAAWPVGYCGGWTSAPINVVTVQPAMVGCLQVQPVETLRPRVDVQSQVGRKQVPVFGDAAPATVHPLGERLFLTVPAQTCLGQGSRCRVELVEASTAGAFSLAAHHLHQQPRCPVTHTAREVLLPCEVIDLLARDVGAVRQQPVGQTTVQRFAVLGQPAMLLAPDNPDLLARPTQGVVAAHTSGFVVAVVFLYLQPRRTVVDHQAALRWTSTSILSAGLRPATHGMGLTPDLKSGACAPRFRSMARLRIARNAKLFRCLLVPGPAPIAACSPLRSRYCSGNLGKSCWKTRTPGLPASPNGYQV
jgi:hypothetical protein